MDKSIQVARYVDTKFIAGMATGGLFATACYVIFQHVLLLWYRGFLNLQNRETIPM